MAIDPPGDTHGVIELQQSADGAVALLLDGQPWQPWQRKHAIPAYQCAAAVQDAQIDCTATASAASADGADAGLTSEESKAMAAAMSTITALNSEVDEARAAGKLIEGAHSADKSTAQNACLGDDSASVGGSKPVAQHTHYTEGGGEVAHAAVQPSQRSIGVGAFKKLGILGKGAVGKCYLVREKGTNQLYAMKVMGKADITARNKGKRIMLEREVMIMSRHPLLVELHASFQSTDFLHHVMEYCPGGPLYGVLRRQPYCRFDEASSRFYVAVSTISFARSPSVLVPPSHHDRDCLRTGDDPGA
jgi:hypothetical protein